MPPSNPPIGPLPTVFSLVLQQAHLTRLTRVVDGNTGPSHFLLDGVWFGSLAGHVNEMHYWQARGVVGLNRPVLQLAPVAPPSPSIMPVTKPQFFAALRSFLNHESGWDLLSELSGRHPPPQLQATPHVILTQLNQLEAFWTGRQRVCPSIILHG